MSERYNVEVEDVLGENYKITNIECSDYNPSIDGNITVTITVNDVYGDAVSGESVTVTASEGTFTQLNGSDITSASSVTGTTNSSGQFTLTYACSEWGLITFSANNVSSQIRVTGWRTVTNDSNYIIKYNENLVSTTVKASGSFSYSTTYTEFAAEVLIDNTHNVDLRPRMPMSIVKDDGNIVMIKDNSYKVGRFRISGTGTSGAYAHFTYERR